MPVNVAKVHIVVTLLRTATASVEIDKLQLKDGKL